MKAFKYVRNQKDKHKFGNSAVGRINTGIQIGWSKSKLQLYCKNSIKTNKAEILHLKKFPEMYHENTWKSLQFEVEQFEKFLKSLAK